MSPHKSYRIWFSQRNGSTLLCKGLEQTGICGIPGEYFNVMESESLCDKYGIETYDQLREAIWKLGTSSNGVFGIKHSLHTSNFRKIYKEIKSLKGIPQDATIDRQELLSDLFPNCKHIFLTRRNKVRQAVSWWKAIKDNAWHLTPEQEFSDKEAFYDQHYDFDALSHLFKETVLRECAIQEYFTKYNIRPLTFVYEDFVANFEDTIKQIIEYLEIEYNELDIKEKYYRKTANANSEKWVMRFRKDLQEQMGAKIW